MSEERAEGAEGDSGTSSDDDHYELEGADVQFVHDRSVVHWLVRHGKADAVKRTLSTRKRNELRQCFDTIDTDGSGTIDYDELNEALELLGMEAEPAKARDDQKAGELGQLLLQAEGEREGGAAELEIEFDEFVQLMMARQFDVRSVKKGNEGAGTPSFLDIFPLMAKAYDLRRTVSATGAPKPKPITGPQRLRDNSVVGQLPLLPTDAAKRKQQHRHRRSRSGSVSNSHRDSTRHEGSVRSQLSGAGGEAEADEDKVPTSGPSESEVLSTARSHQSERGRKGIFWDVFNAYGDTYAEYKALRRDYEARWALPQGLLAQGGASSGRRAGDDDEAMPAGRTRAGSRAAPSGASQRKPRVSGSAISSAAGRAGGSTDGSAAGGDESGGDGGGAGSDESGGISMAVPDGDGGAHGVGASFKAEADRRRVGAQFRVLLPAPRSSQAARVRTRRLRAAASAPVLGVAMDGVAGGALRVSQPRELAPRQVLPRRSGPFASSESVGAATASGASGQLELGARNVSRTSSHALGFSRARAHPAWDAPPRVQPRVEALNAGASRRAHDAPGLVTPAVASRTDQATKRQLHARMQARSDMRECTMENGPFRRDTLQLGRSLHARQRVYLGYTNPMPTADDGVHEYFH